MGLLLQSAGPPAGRAGGDVSQWVWLLGFFAISLLARRTRHACGSKSAASMRPGRRRPSVCR